MAGRQPVVQMSNAGLDDLFQDERGSRSRRRLAAGRGCCGRSCRRCALTAVAYTLRHALGVAPPWCSSSPWSVGAFLIMRRPRAA